MQSRISVESRRALSAAHAYKRSVTFSGYAAITASIGSLRLLAEDGDAAQQAALGRREVGAGMQGAAIVPHQDVADAPDMFINELALLLVIEQRVQQLLALGRRQAFDGNGHQPV